VGGCKHGVTEWGAKSPGKRKALRQLDVSEKITQASQNARERIFHDLEAMIENGFEAGILRRQPISFLGEIFFTLADAALEKASRDPANFDQYKSLGWKALWGAIARAGERISPR
jgi:hypothetical protein